MKNFQKFDGWLINRKQSLPNQTSGQHSSIDKMQRVK